MILGYITCDSCNPARHRHPASSPASAFEDKSFIWQGGVHEQMPGTRHSDK